KLQSIVFASRRRHTSFSRDWSSDVCSSDLGDAERGERVFWNHETAVCTRCHALKDSGGNAGPALDHVGSTLTREQLLEALVLPRSEERRVGKQERWLVVE